MAKPTCRWYRSVKATGNKGHHIHTICMTGGAAALVFPFTAAPIDVCLWINGQK